MTFTKGNVITLIVVALIIVVAAFYTWKVVQKKEVEALIESPAGQSLSKAVSSAPYTDLEGSPVNLDDYIGQVLVVTSWASWCPACGDELKELANLSKLYKEQDVMVVAINRAEPANTANRFLKHINAENEINLVLDPDDRYYNSIKGYAMPETVFYDRSGNITHHAHADITLPDMEEYVEQAIAASDTDYDR